MPKVDQCWCVCNDTREPRIKDISKKQFEAIAEAAHRDGVLLETEPSGEAPTHVWQKDHILVSGEVDETANKDLQELKAELAPDQKIFRDRVKLLKLAENDHKNTWEAVQFLNGRDGLEGKVFVNNLMYVAHGDGANFCPADEPGPIRPFPETIPYPPPSRGNAGRGVRIAVIDTGLSPGWRENHPWLVDDRRGPSVSGEPESNTFENGKITEHAGHGMFIAGVIRCVAPGATVKVYNAMPWSGAVTEHALAQKIFEVLDENPAPDIISLSAGCIPMHDPSKVSAEPQAMHDVMTRLNRPGCRTLLVAAAGNDGLGPEHGWFYPARFAEDKQFSEFVVAVGALRQDRRGRACFSNYGHWVTVYEDGEKLVNAFLEGSFEYQEPLGRDCVYHVPPLYEGCSCVIAPPAGTVARFRGMAVWSGTSFATPIVVGRVARRMTRTRRFAGRPRMAMKDLLNCLIDVPDTGELLPAFPTPVGR